MRRPPDRRAGSTNAASQPSAAGSTVRTSAHLTSTRPSSPSAAALARATADGGRVLVHPEHRQPGPGEGEQVAADAAAQVGHPSRAGRGEAFRAVGRDGGAGRLLEAVRGPEQAVGVGPEAEPPRAAGGVPG